MTSRTGSLGTVLQGVSQQQPRVRLMGQVKEQLNMHSDVVRGLVSRPPVLQVAALSGTSTALKFDDLDIDGTRYFVGWREGVLKVWDLAGNTFTLNTQDISVVLTAATFTESGKTLNETGAFAGYSFTAGDVIYINGGTGVIPGGYTIASRTSDDEIVLETTITNDASDPTDVTSIDAAVGYIGDNMSFHVYDDTIYVVNHDITVLEQSVVDSSSAQQQVGYVQSLGGSFGRDMVIRITYDSDASFRQVAHNIPDTDPDKVNGDYIMEQLFDGLDSSGGANNVNSGTLKGTTNITRFRNVIKIQDDTETFKLTVTDGDDGKVLRQHINSVDKIENLIRFASEGTLVKVEGEELSDDDFWMRFDVEDETVVGNGFGVNGVWRESVNVYEATSLDFSTMPHIIYMLSGEFYFERNLWQKRRAGDEETNEHPSFVGFPITEIGGFQSRLMFTAGPNVIASRSNIPSDFYKKSVVVDSDTDPLDFASTTESEVALQWMVPFDRDMLVMSERHQFIISGSTALTPTNAAMVLTTDFEMAQGARPSSTGRTILFPYQVGVHAGLKEFFSSDEIATNGADNITETLSHYIHGTIAHISTSTNFNTALVHAMGGVDEDGNTVLHTLYVYKYLWEGIEKKQSSMSRWTFPLNIVYMFWDNETIYLLLRNGDDYVLGSMDMDYNTHDVGFTPTLDLQSDETADGSFQVTVPYDDASFVQHTNCTNPGSQVTEVSKSGSGPYTYTFDEAVVPSGAVVIAGLPYDQYVEPTMPFVRDRNGIPVIDNKLVVSEFVAVFEDSGTINSLMTSKYRGDETFDNNKVIAVDDVEDPLQIGIRSGDFRIPWGEDSEWSQLRLTSTGIRPMAILEIEWRGQAFKRGK